jgi:hypothetical protein
MSDSDVVTPFGKNVIADPFTLAGSAGLTATAVDTIPATTALAGSAGFSAVGVRGVLGGISLHGTAGQSVIAINTVINNALSFQAGVALTAIAIIDVRESVGMGASTSLTTTAVETELGEVLFQANATLSAVDNPAGVVILRGHSHVMIDADAAPSTSPDHVEYTNTVMYQNLQPRHASLATQSETTQYMARSTQLQSRQAQRRRLPITQFNFRGR